MKIGKFECTLKRTGIISIKYHPEFTAWDMIAVHKFMERVAKRNKHKLPIGILFI